jgi:hypothetical protein
VNDWLDTWREGQMAQAVVRKPLRLTIKKETVDPLESGLPEIHASGQWWCTITWCGQCSHTCGSGCDCLTLCLRPYSCVEAR